MFKYLCVLAGGGSGALLRYIVATSFAARYGGRFPLGTFVINVSGSFIIGLLMTFFTQRVVTHHNWQLLLVTGVLGGYTTFSSFEYETLVASQTGAPGIALLYVASSVIAGYIAVYLGYWLMLQTR